MAAPTATVIRCSRKEHGTKLNGKDTVNMQYAENDKKKGEFQGWESFQTLALTIFLIADNS